MKTQTWALVLGLVVGCTPTAPAVSSSSSDARVDASSTNLAPTTEASAPPTTTTSTILPGSALGIDEARSGSQSVVVATIRKVGEPSPGAPMEAHYDAAEAEVVRVLSGAPASGTIKLSYKVKTAPAAPVSESPPVRGENYILFLSNARAIKMLAATDENIARITKP